MRNFLIVVLSICCYGVNIFSQTSGIVINDIDSAFERAMNEDKRVFIVFTSHGSSSTTLRELYSDHKVTTMLDSGFVQLWLHLDDKQPYYLYNTLDTFELMEKEEIVTIGDANKEFEYRLVHFEGWPAYAITDSKGQLLYSLFNNDSVSELKRMIEALCCP